MGVIKEWNDSIWKVLLNLLSKITDNVYLEIFIAAGLFGILMIIVKSYINAKIKKPVLLPFGISSMLFTISVGYMVERLPMIHSRMNRALGTTASILEASATYMSDFEHAANRIVTKSSEIVSYLYYLSPTAREQWKCEPEQLYDSVFRTFDKIRGGWILPDVHLTSIWTFTIPFVLCILTIIIMAFVVTDRTETKNSYDIPKILWYIIQSAFLVYTTSVSNGAFICAWFLWIIELFGLQLLKTEPGSVFISKIE